MRKLALLLFGLCLLSCNGKAQKKVVPIHDTIAVVSHANCDSLQAILSSYKAQIDSLNKVIKSKDSISSKDFTYGFKYERIKYYYNICEKRPANKKYFYGWVRRVLKSK